MIKKQQIRSLITICTLLFTTLSYGQTIGVSNFGANRPQDTSKTKGQIVATAYANPNPEMFVRFDSKGHMIMAVPGAGGADSSIFVTITRLRDSLLLKVSLSDSGVIYVTPKGLADAIAAIPGVDTNGLSDRINYNLSRILVLSDSAAAAADSINVLRVAVDGKEPIIVPGTSGDYWQGDKTWQPKSGLPIGTATQAALDGKVPYTDTSSYLPTKYFLTQNYFRNGGNAWAGAWSIGDTGSNAGRVLVNNTNVMDFFVGGNVGIKTFGTNTGFSFTVGDGSILVDESIAFNSIISLYTNTGSFFDNMSMGNFNTNLVTGGNNRTYLIGSGNTAPASGSFIFTYGYGNTQTAVIRTNTFGYFNTITAGHGDINVIGNLNTVNYTGGTLIGGASIIGTNNKMLHRYSMLFGTGGVTTGNNQLIFNVSQANTGASVAQIRDVYFGNPKSDNSQDSTGVSVTIHAGGAGAKANRTADFLRLAGGLATDTATGGDVIFATGTSSATSNGTLQSLTNRMRVKWNTGYVGVNTDNPLSRFHLVGSARVDDSTHLRGRVYMPNLPRGIQDSIFYKGANGEVYIGVAPAGGGSTAWGGITGTLSAQTDLQAALDAKQNALGFTAEDIANKATDFSTVNNTKYPTVEAVENYVTAGIAALSSVYVPVTTTINGIALSSNVTLDIDDVAPTQTGNAGKVLTTNGTNATWVTPSGGGGLDLSGQISYSCKANGNTTALQVLGSPPITISGSTVGTLASTNALTQKHRVNMGTSTSANQRNGLSGTATTMRTYMGAHFIVTNWFGLENFDAGQRIGIGLAGDSPFMSTLANPSAYAFPLIAIGKDVADATFHVLTNDASGTPTKTNTGISFASTSLYKVQFSSTGANVDVTLTEYTAAGATNTYTLPTATTDIPAAGQELLFSGTVGNAATGVAISYTFISVEMYPDIR